ncbi:hypothetical protein [Leifsonia sp. 2MCAF36]|uniref:hypothetical protein n=1 Tax=Leifsonia sp. 2MCAF36 TaxID=3232988 RepID=UPI003F9AA446
MELTVIRAHDRRRMVVSVEAGSEAEALRTIQKAVGPVTLDPQQMVAPRRRSAATKRRARGSAYF